MVQPVMTSMGRTAKVFATTGNRVISETFKDKKGTTTIVTRVLNSEGDVLATRMKRLFSTLLLNGKKILTRNEEIHAQEKVAGTDIPKKGREYINKFFYQKDRLLSADGKQLFKSEMAYKKPYNSDLYVDKNKILESKKLKCATTYKDAENPSKAIRDLKVYAGENKILFEHDVLVYDSKGIPLESNEFDLTQFEMFKK